MTAAGFAQAAAPTSETRQRLSTAQMGLWLLQSRFAHDPLLNLCEAFQVRRRLDPASVRRALTHVVARHRAFRARIVETVEGVWYDYADTAPLCFRVQEFPSDIADLQSVIDRACMEEARRPFSLSEAPLVRFALFLAGRNAYIVATAHHLIADGWSFSVLFSDLRQAYETGRLPAWADEPAAARLIAAEAARPTWVRATPPLTTFPPDEARPRRPSAAGDELKFGISRPLADSVARYARLARVSRFSVHLAAFLATLEAFTGQRELLVGAPVSTRVGRSEQKQIGCFVDTAVLFSDVDPAGSFGDLVSQVHATSRSGLTNSRSRLAALAEQSRERRDPATNTLIQTLFVYQNFPRPSATFDGARASGAKVFPGSTQFDTTFTLEETPTGLAGAVEYRRSLYRRETIARIVESYKYYLREFLRAPDRPLGSINLVHPGDRGFYQKAFNATREDYGAAPRLLSELVEREAVRAPGRIALRSRHGSLTFADLDARTAEVARDLRRRGVRCGDVVGHYYDRSIDAVVALIGTLRSGAVYLPLDKLWPEQRLRQVAEVARPRHVLTDVAILPAALRDLTEGAAPDGASHVRRRGRAALAYVIFTSGSTGRPKGVLTRHRAILNRVLWMMRHFELTADDVVLHKTPYTFDISLWEIFWPLALGATVFVAEPHEQGDVARVEAILREERVTAAHFVPSMLELLVETASPASLAGLNRVFCSGEALSATTVRKLFTLAPTLSAHNLYGPTEAAVEASAWTCSPLQSRVPIGRPIGNVQLHVLNERRQHCPVGVTGEIYIGGIGLAEGYIADPEASARSFVKVRGCGRLYRTGDLGRQLPGGELEFLGRADSQVKIRGYRIELGEIERVLLGAGGVAEAVACVQGRTGPARHIVAYVTLEQGAASSTASLKRRLQDALPPYMTPSRIEVLDQMPLMSNGKVDRRALAAAAETAETGAGRCPEGAPLSAVGRQVLDLWREVLGDPNLAVDDDFFEYGGNSLLAQLVVMRLREKLGRPISLSTLFENANARDFCRELSA